MKICFSLICAFVLFSIQSCGLYKFSEGSIPPGMKTLSVQLFENNAPLVVPYLSRTFTEALKDRIRNQSRLSIVRVDGDADFEGRITEYSFRPVAVTGNERAGLTRLTISMNVKFRVNMKDVDGKEIEGFEQTFSRFKDFSTANRSLQSQEQELINDITKMLTEDIFNRAFANW